MPIAAKRMPTVDFSPANEKERFVISGVKRGEQLNVDSETLNFEINKRANAIGKYNVDYEDTNEEHEVHITYGAEHIPGSPFTMPAGVAQDGSDEDKKSPIGEPVPHDDTDDEDESSINKPAKETTSTEAALLESAPLPLAPKMYFHNGENTFSIENVPEADQQLQILGGIGFKAFADANNPDLVHVDYKLKGIQDVEVKYANKSVDGGYFTLVPHHLRDKFEKASEEERDMMKTLSAFESGRVVHSQEEKAAPKIEEVVEEPMAAPVQPFAQENVQRGALLRTNQPQQQQMAEQVVQQQQQQVVVQQQQQPVLRSQPARYRVIRTSGM